MFIGEVSKITKLSVKAIRLYEEKGLIVAPKRKGVYRIYTEEHLEVLNLISEAKELGLTLAEIRGVISYQNGKANWSEINKFLVLFKHKFENELQDITKKITRIETCISTIESCKKHLDSPLKGRL